MRTGATIRIRILVLAACAVAACAHAPVIPAILETPPVGVAGDAADDPAIWVAPDPGDSRVIGTQKQGGYFVYDLVGRVVQEFALGRPNNVDLAPDFAWPDGAAPIVVASDRADNTVPLFRWDTARGAMEQTPRARIATGFGEVYGVCVGRRGADTLVVATSKSGDVGVWRIATEGAGVSSVRIAAFSLGSIAEGCVVDGAADAYYVAQELRGLWRIGLDDSTGANRVMIDGVGQGRLFSDVEGIGIWEGPGATGYLAVSVQGRSRFAVYDRAAPNAYRGSFSIGRGGTADRVTGTDGLAVSSAPLGPSFPRGILVVQDDANSDPRATQNFKYVSWGAVAEALGLE